MELIDTLLRIVPIAFAAALSPFNITVVILMLLSREHPAGRATAFIAGFAVSLIFVGGLAVAFISNIYTPPLRPRVYVLVAILGGLMLLFGVRQLVMQVDPEETPKSWMDRITQFRPFTAFWVGFFISTFGVKTIAIYIACLGLIASADLGPVRAMVAVGITILVVLSTMLVPLLIFVFQRDRGTQILERARVWMLREQHRIGGAIMLIVGLTLVIVGTNGLL